MIPFTLTLPIPPSVNAMYVNRSSKGARGRMISPAYVAWRSEADAAVWQQKPLASFPGRIGVCMDCGETRGLADLDGRWKAILDLLVRLKIIVNDDRRYVRLLFATWNKDRKDCCVTISEME